MEQSGRKNARSAATAQPSRPHRIPCEPSPLAASACWRAETV